jgi:hypothetical protein
MSHTDAGTWFVDSTSIGFLFSATPCLSGQRGAVYRGLARRTPASSESREYDIRHVI